jgi:hypothetical protein
MQTALLVWLSSVFDSAAAQLHQGIKRVPRPAQALPASTA